MKLYKKMNGKDFEVELHDSLAKKMLEKHGEYFVKKAEPKSEKEEPAKEPSRGRPRKG